MENLQTILLKEFSDESERSFTLGDAFDMKASILLIVITFLATQTASFLAKADLPVIWYGQIVAAFLLAGAGVLTIWELLPREYIFFSPSNGAIERKIAKLQQEHGDGHDHKVSEHLIEAQIEWARERALKHKSINRRKSSIIYGAFVLIAGAFAINITTVLFFVMRPFLAAHWGSLALPAWVVARAVVGC
jgi:archaellum biogenesis protein FlaJ (TadC family)